MNDDDTGFNVVPQRYQTESGREAIDIIRDLMTDEQFIGYCRGTALKYRLRLGKKDAIEVELEKSRWYAEMAWHVVGEGSDPRSERPGFTPYERQPWAPEAP